MIEDAVIHKLATAYQTTTLNVAREYCQHLLLSTLYQHKEADRILFKGGTALRIVYGSPRFSSDLDFSGFGIRPSLIEGALEDTLSEIERFGMRLALEEAKTTSGGYLSIIHYRFLSYHVEIQLEISLRSAERVKPMVNLIANDFLPAYTLLSLPQALLVDEKLGALRTRGKARDWFDLYFMLRKGLLPPEKRKGLAPFARQLQDTRRKREIAQELKTLALFLPKNHQRILVDFPATLARELQRYVK